MKILKNKITLYGIALMIAFTVIGFAIDEYSSHQEEQKKHQAYAQIIPLIELKETDDFETTVDKVRSFLFEHTQFDMSPDFYELWGNHHAIAYRIIAHAKGENNKRAPLECSSRSGILESIIQTLGYKTRSISTYMYSDHYPSHTFSEVQNPETKKWHVQDVQHDQFWRMKNTGARASIHDLIKNYKSTYIPCRTKTHCITWDKLSRENETPHKLEAYYDSASIIDRNNNSRPFLVNAKRFDLNTPLKIKNKDEPMTYCEYRKKDCRDEIIIYNEE